MSIPEKILGSKVTITLISLFIVFLGSWAYSPALDVLFVFDDQQNIVDSPAVHWTELSSANLAALLNASRLQSRPIANLSFALDHLRGGLDPGVFHLTNILIHFAVGLALLWLALLYVRLAQPMPNRGEFQVRNVALALLVVGIFLVHPLNTQAVTYVVQRMASLATFFTSLAFASYLVARYRLSTRSLAWYLFALFCWVLAVGSKEIGLLLLPVVLLYELCFFRTEWQKRAERLFGGKWDRKWTRRAWAGSGIACVLVAWLVMMSSNVIGLTETWPGRDFNGVERLMTQARVMVFHLSQVGWPSPDRLNLEHDFEVSRGLLQPATTLPAILACVALLVAAASLAIRRPRYGFPLLAYAVFHSIESGPVGLEIAFEHRMYLPSSMFVLAGAAILVDSGPSRQFVTVVAMCLTLPVLSVWTHERNQLWTDPIKFHRDMASKSPENTRVQYNLALILNESSRNEEALPVIRQAIAIDPSDGDLRRLLGSILLDLGQTDEAVLAYQDAVTLEPGKIRSVLGLGTALEASGATGKAFEHYLSTGLRFGRAGNPWEAIPILERAVKLRENDAEALNALGSAYMSAGLQDKALKQFQAALEANPGKFEAWYNLGLVADKLDMRDEAIRGYKGFVATAPAELRQHVLRAEARILALEKAGETQ